MRKYSYTIFLILSITLSTLTVFGLSTILTSVQSHRPIAVVTLNSLTRGRHLGVRTSLVKGRTYLAVLQVQLISGDVPKSAVEVDAPGFDVKGYSHQVKNYPNTWAGPPVQQGGVVIDVFTIKPLVTGKRVIRFSKIDLASVPQIIGTTVWVGTVH